jgi:hypothetical protein
MSMMMRGCATVATASIARPMIAVIMTMKPLSLYAHAVMVLVVQSVRSNEQAK